MMEKKKAKDLYRRSALEKLSSPDQLDKVIKITSPMSWMALAAVTVVIAVMIAWAFMGTISETIMADGMVVAPVGTNVVYTGVTGTISEMYISVGDELDMDMPVMTIMTPNGENTTIFSDQIGYVSEIMGMVGHTVWQNSELVRVSPKVEVGQVVVCYVPISNVKKLRRDMMAYVMLTADENKIYGHMKARIVNIDARAASVKSMESIMGHDNKMADFFMKDSAVACVTLELYPDENTVSGYDWSSEQGKKQTVSNGSLCSVRVITREIHPIEKLFVKLSGF